VQIHYFVVCYVDIKPVKGTLRHFIYVAL